MFNRHQETKMAHIQNKQKLDETIELRHTTATRLIGASASTVPMIEYNPVNSPGIII